MSIKATVLRNAFWNWAGMAVALVTAFVTTPFLVRTLGETNYGLWIVLASFTSYFGMLDLGVRGAVGRQVAYRLARHEHREVNAVLSTALAILGVAGLLALLASVLASFWITRLFDIPPGQVGEARVAFWLIGLNLALWLTLNVFDATLWAFQRFDLLNVIDVSANLLRTALTFLLIGRPGYGLVTLAWLNLITLAGAQVLKGVVSFRVYPQLRAGVGLVGRAALRELMGYGIWAFLLNLARTLTAQASTLVIGARLGIQFVTPYSVASRLVSSAGALIVAGTGVLTPVATGFHAAGSHDRERTLFLEGGKICTALSLFFLTLFLLLGRSLISAWMGPSLVSSSFPLLAILAAGEALPMSQWITNGVILGKGRHRPLAVVNFIEGGVAVGLATLMSRRFGLTGVVFSFAVPAVFCRGLFQLVYGCRVVGVPLGAYLSRVVAPVAAAAVLPAAALAVTVAWEPPVTRAGFFLTAAAYSLAYLATVAWLLVGPRRLRGLYDGLARKYLRSRA